MRWLDNVRTLSFVFQKQPWEKSLSATGGGLYYFGSGREALFALIQSRKWDQPIVLLPAMTPEGLYFPFAYSGWKILFYELDPHGNPDWGDITQRVTGNPPTVAILIHLFGIPRDAQPFRSLLPKETLLIEDFAHTMYGSWMASHPQIADAWLFSPPKLLGTTDGCIMVAFNPKVKFIAPKLFSPTRSLYLLIRLISLVGASVSQWMGRMDSLDIFDFTAARAYGISYKLLMKYSPRPHTFSYIGRWLFNHCSQEKIGKHRLKQGGQYHKDLYNPQLQSLCDEPSWPSIGFPIRIKNKDSFIAHLAQKGIRGAAYADHWWFVPEEIAQEYPVALQLLQEHFVLPVNQKLTIEDIAFIIKTANAYY